MSQIGFTSQEDWHTVYEVMLLTRADIQRVVPVAQTDSLTDADMHQIAQLLKEAIEEAGIWEELPHIIKFVLQQKEECSGLARLEQDVSRPHDKQTVLASQLRIFPRSSAESHG